MPCRKELNRERSVKNPASDHHPLRHGVGEKWCSGLRGPKAGVLGLLGVLVAGMFLSAWNCAAQTNGTNNASSGLTYDSFQIITRNNIFDPNRRYEETYHRPNQHPPANRFSLVGTMSYPKGKFAFFDSPNADYKKVLEPGGSIAGYTVKDVDAGKITLALNGKDTDMNVGQEMRKSEGETNWRLSGHVEEPENTDATNGVAEASPESSTAPTGATPEMSDTLKRLMQQRKQELSK